MNLLIELCPNDAILLGVASVLAQIAIVALLAWLLSSGFARHCPAIRHAVWACALVCILICPAVSYVALRVGWSLVSLRWLPGPASVDIEVRQPPQPGAVRGADLPAAADAQTSERSEDLRPEPQTVPYGISTPNPVSAGAANFAPPPRPRDPRRALLGMVTLFWTAGVAFLGARLFHGWRRMIGLKRHLQPATGDRLRDILPELRRILNVKSLPPLAILPHGVEWAGPIAIGLFRPLVILPENLVHSLDSRGLRDVLLHEFAHALRHDPLVGLLQRLLAIAYWPYPPLHLVNRHLARAREEVCDNYVLRQGDAPGYAETLLVISETLRCLRLQSAALGICHPRERLQQRVAGLLDPRRNVMTRVHCTILAAFTALFLTPVVVVAGTRVLEAETPAAAPTSAAAPADSTSTVQRRAVNKRVKDFPETVDRSSPESTLAAICRADARADIRALHDLVLADWDADDAKNIEQAFKDTPVPPKNREERILEIEIVEVLTYRDDCAVVICRLKSPAEEERYGGILMVKINGQWKGNLQELHKDGLPSLEAARDYVERNKASLDKSFAALKDKAAKVKVEPSKPSPLPWVLPDGRVITESSSGPAIKEEVKKLIAEKKYTLLSTLDSPVGEKQYVYRFDLADGSSTRNSFSMPLDGVSSWDDYQQKQGEQRQQRHDRINQAVAAGRFRLLNVEVMQIHLCRDVPSDKKFKVQRIERPDGSEIAFPRADFGSLPPFVTSWQEHLQAIRAGTRTLLALETVNSYTYEMTADDGTKLVFQYGGNEPLKTPEK